MSTTTVGGVEIAIGANTDGLAAGMAKAKTTVKSGMDSIQGAAQAVQGYLSMLGVDAFAGYIKGAIDAAGALADMAQRTGVSAEVLSGFEYAAKMSGTTLEGIGNGLKKLATNMYDTSRGTGDAKDAFKELGIQVVDGTGKLRATDSVMLDVADRFAEMDDGPRKAALAMKIFGRSGEELIPLLNEGADGIEAMRKRAEELGLVVSDQTASAMESLGDKFDTVGMASQGTARQIAAGLTPALTVVADAFLDATRGGGALSGATQVLVGFFKGLISVGLGVAAMVDRVGVALGAMAAAVMNPSKALEILKQNSIDDGELMEKWGAKINAVWDDTTVAVVKATNATKGQTEEQKKQTEATKKQISEAEKHAKQIGAVTGKLSEEIAMMKLSGVEAEIYKQLKAAGVTANSKAGQEIAMLVTTLSDEKQALKAAAEAAKENTKEVDALFEAQEKMRLGNEAQIKTARTMLENIQIETSLLNMNTQERALATLERELERQGIVKGTQAYEAYLQKLKDATLLKSVTEAQVKTANDTAKAWEESAKQIEKALTDSLMRGFESGKGMVDSIRDYIANAFKSMVVKLAVQPIMGAVTGAMGLLTGNSAMAASGAAQQASGMSNIMSTISTIGTMASAFGSSLAAGFSATISSFGATTALAIEGGMASIAVGTSASIASGLGAIVGTLGPYALAAVAVYGLLGGFKGTYVTGQGKNATYGADGTRTGTSVRQWDRVSDGGKPFVDFLDGIANTYQQMARGLGIKTGALGLGFETNDSEGGKYGFNATVNGRTALQVDETKITDGAIALTASRAVFAALQASEMPRYLAGIFDGMTASAMTHEQLNAALQTAQAYQALHTTLESLPLANLRDLSYEAASGLVAAAGGMDKLISGLQAYYDQFYTESEKTATAAGRIQRTLKDAGLEAGGLSSKAEFRALLESIDVSTAGGQKQVAALLQVAPQFAAIADALGGKNNVTLSALADLGPKVTALETALEGGASATANTTSIATEIGAAVTRAVDDAMSRAGATLSTAASTMQTAADSIPSRIEIRVTTEVEATSELVGA